MVILVICLGLMVFGVTYLALTYTFDMPIQTINKQIDDGMLSQDTVNAFQRMLDLWKITPLFLLIGLILFIYERGKGTDLPATLFFEYEILMIVAVVVSAYMTWAYGLSVDAIFQSFDTNPIMNNINPIFDTSGSRMICLKMMYIGCLLPGYVGCFLYMIHPIIRQTDSTFLSADDPISANKDEYVTDYKMQQF